MELRLGVEMEYDPGPVFRKFNFFSDKAVHTEGLSNNAEAIKAMDRAGWK